LTHNLINDKLLSLIQKIFAIQRRLSLPMVSVNNIECGSVAKFVEHFPFILDNIYVRFGNAVCKQIIGIQMGTYCAPLIADLFLYFYDRDFMLSYSPTSHQAIIYAFNIISRYQDDILNMNNPYSDQLVSKIYHSELKLNKTNSSDVLTSFLDLKFLSLTIL
jgi:hypothetical protein